MLVSLPASCNGLFRGFRSTFPFLLVHRCTKKRFPVFVGKRRVIRIPVKKRGGLVKQRPRLQRQRRLFTKISMEIIFLLIKRRQNLRRLVTKPHHGSETRIHMAAGLFQHINACIRVDIIVHKHNGTVMADQFKIIIRFNGLHFGFPLRFLLAVHVIHLVYFADKNIT